jgi:hypothetical protein
MLTRILHPSEKLCAFFNQFNLSLSQPQRRHLLNMADALLVCEDTKTLAALQRQFVEAVDASNMADFLRISPWSAHELRQALRADQVAWLLEEADRTKVPQIIYINLDLRREGQSDPTYRTGGLVSRPQRKHEKEASVQERILLSGVYDACRSGGGHRRPTLVPARENSAALQSASLSRKTTGLSTSNSTVGMLPNG